MSVRVLLVALAFVLATLPLRAQDLASVPTDARGRPTPVSFSLDAPGDARAGAPLTATLTATIAAPWHLYSLANAPDAGPVPTTLRPARPYLTAAGDPTETAPERAFDANFNTTLGWHAGTATFRVPLRLAAEAPASADLAVAIRYQACTDRMCLPPRTDTVAVPLRVAGGAAISSSGTADAATPAPAIAAAEASAPWADRGFGGFLWLAFLAGLGALLTPCVFPMVPLTVSYFAGKHGGDRRRATRDALAFGAVTVAAFTLLGVLLAVAVGAAGANRLAANPWVNLVIGGVLVVFALSLLGAYELRLPARLTNALDRESRRRGGAGGLVFLALTLAAVSFSCTAPFVGAVLAAAAQGAWAWPIAGMAVFATAFALPFVALALFPARVAALPRSGPWLATGVVVLGFVELGAAFKFLSNADLVWGLGLLPRPLVVAVWVALAIALALYLLGLYGLREVDRPAHVSAARLVGGVVFLALAASWLPGLAGAPLGAWDAFLPPRRLSDPGLLLAPSAVSPGAGAASAGEDGWSEDYAATLAAARTAGEPVFVDFTGYTCTNCRAMETRVFPRPEIAGAFERFARVRLYTDGPDAERLQRLQLDLTGTVALPTYAVVDPATGRAVRVLSGYVEPAAFAAFLNAGGPADRAER